MACDVNIFSDELWNYLQNLLKRRNICMNMGCIYVNGLKSILDQLQDWIIIWLYKKAECKQENGLHKIVPILLKGQTCIEVDGMNSRAWPMKLTKIDRKKYTKLAESMSSAHINTQLDWADSNFWPFQLVAILPHQIAMLDLTWPWQTTSDQNKR